MRFLGLLICCALASASASAAFPQAQAGGLSPFELDGTQQRPKLLSREEVIRAEDEPASSAETPIQRAMHARSRIYDNFESVQLSVQLNINGRVDSAKPVGGPERFYERATQIEMHREFAPVLDHERTIVPAHFTDYVRIYPPERWSDHPVPFPEQVDLRTFRIELERTGCMGSCPPYKVIVLGSGEVIWEGDSYVAVPGTHRSTISTETVKRLLDQVRASHILNALDEYEAGWTDNAAYTLNLDVNGIHKQIRDYIGPIVGMPLSIRELETDIDEDAGTQKWIEGDASLLPALKAEHWDFASRAKDNLLLYDSMLERSNQEVLAAYRAAHGPIFSPDPGTPSPVCVASRTTDSHTAIELLSSMPKGVQLPQNTLDACLVDSARAGNLELVDLWLKRGAAVAPAPLPRSGPDEEVPEAMRALTAAIQGGSPAVIQRLLEAHAPVRPSQNGGRNLLTLVGENSERRPLADVQATVASLIRAGANPNDETDQDKPALFAVDYQPRLVSYLVQHGARINARDGMGDTPLMSAFNKETLKALIDAGADPTLRNKQGKTAGEQFRAQGLKEQADVLEAAETAWRVQHGLSQPKPQQ